MTNYTTMSFKHKPEVTMTYDRKIQRTNISSGSTSTTTTTTTTATQSIPFNDEGFNNRHLMNSSSKKVQTAGSWAKSIDGLDLDNITPSRLRIRRPSMKMKVLMSEGGFGSTLLGKRPPKSSPTSEDITESCSRLSVNDKADLPPPSKKRDVGTKGKVSVTKNQSNNLDVFDFPDDDDTKPVRRLSNKQNMKTVDKPVRGFNKASSKNKSEEKSTQGFFKIQIQQIQRNETDKSISTKSIAKNFDDMRITRGMIKSPDNFGNGVKMTHGINKTHENNAGDTNVTSGMNKVSKMPEISENNLGGDIRSSRETLNNNLSNNVGIAPGKYKIPDNNKSDDIRVTRGTNKSSTKDNKDTSGTNKSSTKDNKDTSGTNKSSTKDNRDNKRSSPFDIFDFPDSDNEVKKAVPKKKSLNTFTIPEPPKKASKNSIDSSHIIGQNSFSNVNTLPKSNSSSTRISRFLTTKTTKSASSTNNRHSGNRKNVSSDRKSVDDVFDFVKFIRGEAKTKRSARSQSKNGNNEPIIGIVNDRTNNNNIIRPVTSTRKNSQSSSKIIVNSRESPAYNPLKKSRKNSMLLDIPKAPTRTITEVGTPVSFLSFQQKKKPSESSSLWDAVEAVTSPTDLLFSPRKQNLVAKMSKPIPPTKQDKIQLSSYSPTQIYSTFSIPKSDTDVETSKSQLTNNTNVNTKDNEMLSCAGELLASSESVLDLPSSTPSSYNITGGSGRKTYGKGRTILGQDIDSMCFDPIVPSRSIDMEIDDSDINDDNLTPKHKLKSAHELREVGDNTRFTDEMDYILDGIENKSINVRRNSVLELLSKLLDGDFLLRVRAQNYISKIYSILNGNQDSLIRSCFSFIVCMLIEDKNSSESLILEHGFMEFVVNLLNISSDPLSNDYDSLRKSEKSFINDLKTTILKSTVFTEHSQISLKSIALRTLSSLLSLRTRYESIIKNKLRASGGLLSIINILKSELELVNRLLSVIENGKPSSLQEVTLDFILIELCLKILESATLFCSENQTYIVENKDLLHMLLELLLYCQVEACGSNAKDASLALECLLGTLRVLINLTNENLPACQFVGSHLGMSILMRLVTVGQLPSNESLISSTGPSTEEVVKIVNTGNSESTDAVKFDVLLLSIGLLINLVETDLNNQDEFRRVDQNPTCPGSRMCMRTCTCSSRESAVSCLVSLYNYQLEKDDDETDSNIVAAYMAVLLGLLIKNNQANQQLIIERLPDRSVNSLIHLLQQFVHFNELVGEEATASGHVSGQMLMSSSSLNNDQTQQENQGRTIGDSFLEIVDMLKSLGS